MPLMASFSKTEDVICMKILIGTNNKAKTKAVQTVSSMYYPDAQFENREVASLVSDQPMSQEETRQGAINRAKQLMEGNRSILFGIGLEGGVNEIEGLMYICNWGALVAKWKCFYGYWSGSTITTGNCRSITSRCGTWTCNGRLY